MNIADIIHHKLERKQWTKKEIDFLVNGLLDWSVSEAEAGAVIMAVSFFGLSAEETVNLTSAIAKSGDKINWKSSKLNGPLLDKISSGGIGDKITLILAPLVAACGGYVPIISARGLGFSGNTIDKLESIPNYDGEPSVAEFQSITKDIGCAIASEAPHFAPANRSLYTIREAIGASDCISLLVASMLSRKLAAGSKALVADIKVGSGTVISDIETGRLMANTLLNTAKSLGMSVTAVISDSHQVIGKSAGNAVEVEEAIEFLIGKHQDLRLMELVLSLGTEMLLAGKLITSYEEGKRRLRAALDSGEAAEKFSRMVMRLSGVGNILEKYHTILPKAPIIRPVFPDKEGYISSLDGKKIASCLVVMNAARISLDEIIDYRSGLSSCRSLGDFVDLDTPLAYIHAKDEASFAEVSEIIKEAFTISETAPEKAPVIYETLT